MGVPRSILDVEAETFENLLEEGRLQRMLSKNGVAFDDAAEIDPYTCLPTWLHSR